MTEFWENALINVVCRKDWRRGVLRGPASPEPPLPVWT